MTLCLYISASGSNCFDSVVSQDKLCFCFCFVIGNSPLGVAPMTMDALRALRSAWQFFEGVLCICSDASKMFHTVLALICLNLTEYDCLQVLKCF